MEKIILSDKIKSKLNNLVDILYYRQYFGYRESSKLYVDKIYDFIYTIPTLPIKLCKTPKYGKYYAKYDNPKSKMSYYITFNKFENDYVIKDIITPQTKEYLAIRGIK